MYGVRNIWFRNICRIPRHLYHAVWTYLCEGAIGSDNFGILGVLSYPYNGSLLCDIVCGYLSL